MERSGIVLHGHRVSYRMAGRGPLLVLLHAIAGSSATWDEVFPRLGESQTVLAPDLLGHGESAKPEGDCSLGAYANAVRDLLEALELPPGTIVGHSLGGGVSMQIAYQYPERCERLVPVSSGGLGRELHAMPCAAALPGAGVVLPWLRVAGRHSVGRMVHALGVPATSRTATTHGASPRLCSTSSRRRHSCRPTRSACAAGCAPGRSRAPLAEESECDP
jgi:pimeloyl-ACP methyl ester carboxylesterase